MRGLKAALPLLLVAALVGLVAYLARAEKPTALQELPIGTAQRREKPPPPSGAQDWLPQETCLFLTAWRLPEAQASLDELGLSAILRSEQVRRFLEGLPQIDAVARNLRLLGEWSRHARGQVAFALFEDRSWVVASRVPGEAEAAELTRILGKLLGEEPLFARCSEGWHVAGPDSGAAKQVHPGDDPGLSSLDLYQEIASRTAPGEAFGYFNPAFLPAAVPDELGLGTLKAAGWSCRASGLSVRDSFFLWSPGEREGVLKAFSGGRLSPDLAGALPAEISAALLADVCWPSAYAEFMPLARASLPRQARVLDSLVGVVELTLGCPLEKSLAWLGEQSAFAAVIPRHSWPPKAFVTVEIKDREKVLSATQKLFDRLAFFLGGRKTEFEIEGVSVRGLNAAYPLLRSPSYALRDRYILATSHAEVLAAALRRKHGSLAEVEGFRKLSRDLPAERAGLVYVDWPRLFTATYEGAIQRLLERLLPPRKAREELMHAPAVDAFLPHLEVIGGCVSSDEWGLRFDSLTTCGLPAAILGAVLVLWTGDAPPRF